MLENMFGKFITCEIIDSSETESPSLLRDASVDIIARNIAYCRVSPCAGLSNLSAIAGRIDFILGVAGQYAISAGQGDV